MALPQYYQYWAVPPNLQNNGLFNAVIHPNDVAPTSPTGGSLWYNVSGARYEFWNQLASGWSPILSSGNSSFAQITSGTGVHTYLVSGSLRPTGGGVVDANRFNGSSILSAANGGTSTSGFILGCLIYGGGPGVSLLQNSYVRIGGDEFFTLNFLNPSDENKAVINFGIDDFYDGHILGFPTGVAVTSMAAAKAGSISYDGSGIYFCDQAGNRQRILTAGNSNLVNAALISGIVPMAHGGTSSDSSLYLSNGLLYYHPSGFKTLVGTGPAPLSYWDTLNNRWTVTGVAVLNNNYISKSASTSGLNAIIAGSGIGGLTVKASGFNDPNYIVFGVLDGSGNYGVSVTSTGTLVLHKNEFRLVNTTGSKVSFDGAISGQVIKYDGTNWAPANDLTGAAGSVTFGDLLPGTGTATYLVSGTLKPTGGGTVDANRFNGNATISVANGGTSATSFNTNTILYGQGTSAITSNDSFFWNNGAKALNICDDARNVAAFNIGNGVNETLLPRPLFSFPSTYSLLSTPVTGTIEYNTTGLYLTDGIGERKRLVNISDTATSGQIAAYNGVYWVPVTNNGSAGFTQSEVLLRGLGA